MSQRKLAKAIVKDIIEDLMDRRGLRQEWSAIDREIRAQIRGEWEAYALKRLQDPKFRTAPPGNQALPDIDVEEEIS